MPALKTLYYRMQFIDDALVTVMVDCRLWGLCLSYGCSIKLSDGLPITEPVAVKIEIKQTEETRGATSSGLN